MSFKRLHSPELVTNPFIKKRNLEWSIDLADSSQERESQSSSDARNSKDDNPSKVGNEQKQNHPDTAAVEAGEVQIEDHLSYFSNRLASHVLTPSHLENGEILANGILNTPRLALDDYRNLYGANSGSHRGAHFVIHQHDHPVAGTHYDLRLQINPNSSASWAIMYGMPGDPNSRQPNRNATETRVHCLWNHLIETASQATGSLLIWDTGTYTVLPTESASGPDSDPDSPSRSSSSSPSPAPPPASSSSPLLDTTTATTANAPGKSEQEKLRAAFRSRKIRLALHGTRLPRPYIVNLRLTRAEDVAGRAKASASASSTASARRGKYGRRRPRGRQRGGGGRGRARRREVPAPGYSEDEDEMSAKEEADGSAQDQNHGDGDGRELSAMEREIRGLEDEQVRRDNAYPGALNDVGSVHQRRWYLSLDKEGCGFVKKAGGVDDSSNIRGRKGRGTAGAGRWERREEGKAEPEGDGQEKAEIMHRHHERSSFPFHVRGAAVERSVVTGRRGEDVLRDEGVVGYIGRRGWKPVLE